MANTPNSLANSAALPGPLEAGTVLQKRYAVQRLLGGGGMGMVYLAHDQRLSNRPCAIKEMVDHFIDAAQRIEANEYFAREADTLAQLKHPAIPAISDRFDDQNRHYLVMEYVEGRNLEEELAARGGPLPEGLVIDVARQLCDVLAYLHGLIPPIVYRDMKPSNVMLTEKGRVVLVDFGIARLFKAARKGTMIGTLGFAPPEQYQGVADPRSDLYSLGATLHYVVTGRDPEKFPPFSFPPVRTLRPDISTNLAGAIDRALAYEMDGRPASVQEFRDMLLYGRGLDAAGAVRVNAKSGTADLALAALPPEFAEAAARRPRRKPGNWRRRAIGLGGFTLMIAGLAFGATYIYSDPALQSQLGVTQFVDSLPWKHQELLDQARAHPLAFERMTLALSTRSGSPLSAPKASFTDTELANAQYVKWDASFHNNMTGLDGRNDQVEARFFDPSGNQIAASPDTRYVGPNDPAADFSGVALIPNATPIVPGSYKIALYSDDRVLAEQRFDVTPDLNARAAADKAAADAANAARAEAQKAKQDAARVAMIEERTRRPLALQNIEFVNSTKDGTALSGPTSAFNVSKVLFIGWRAVFQNRLYGLNTNQYRVDAAYIGPDGSTLGSVADVQTVAQSNNRAVFSGRVGNSAGGAFLPGQYTVNFYLNGQYFAQRKFRVVADAGLPYTGGGAGGGASSAGGGASGGAVSPAIGLETPTLATGTIDGIGGHGNVSMELRLRPQPNGFLHGELLVHLSGYGMTPIEGFVRGDHLQFQVPYGGETYFFEGQRNHDQLSGTFESTPSGQRGTWTTHAD
ncbi:MAG: serine/threonine protein kinase [Candidatus Binataceae bacterium]|nr:serine/threonine protein kinase [Candidatus Binataceae bacterium]